LVCSIESLNSDPSEFEIYKDPNGGGLIEGAYTRRTSITMELGLDSIILNPTMIPSEYPKVAPKKFLVSLDT
jgi:hypothetical protein